MGGAETVATHDKGMRVQSASRRYRRVRAMVGRTISAATFTSHGQCADRSRRTTSSRQPVRLRQVARGHQLKYDLEDRLGQRRPCAPHYTTSSRET